MKICQRFLHYQDNKCSYKGEFNYPYTVCKIGEHIRCVDQGQIIQPTKPQEKHRKIFNPIMELEI